MKPTDLEDDELLLHGSLEIINAKPKVELSAEHLDQSRLLGTLSRLVAPNFCRLRQLY
jgi:hypothetical protein